MTLRNLFRIDLACPCKIGTLKYRLMIASNSWWSSNCSFGMDFIAVLSKMELIVHIKQELLIIIVIGLVQIREMNFHFPLMHEQLSDLLLILLPLPFLLRPFLQYLTSFLLEEQLIASLVEPIVGQVLVVWLLLLMVLLVEIYWRNLLMVLMMAMNLLMVMNLLAFF